MCPALPYPRKIFKPSRTLSVTQQRIACWSCWTWIHSPHHWEGSTSNIPIPSIVSKVRNSSGTTMTARFHCIQPLLLAPQTDRKWRSCMVLTLPSQRHSNLCKTLSHGFCRTAATWQWQKKIVNEGCSLQCMRALNIDRHRLDEGSRIGTPIDVRIRRLMKDCRRSQHTGRNSQSLVPRAHSQCTLF